MKIIRFTLNYQGDLFEVKFETESIERNRPQEVEFSGFKLDVPELRISHPLLYAEIKKEMAIRASEYWKGVNEEINEIPTLSYQVKEPSPFKGIFDEFNKAFFPIIFLFLLPSISFSQAFVSFEGTNHGVGINAGYSCNHLQMNAGLNSPITRNALAPNIFYISAGSNINITDLISVIPSIGIAKYHVTELITNSHENDIRDINKTALLTSLELGKDFTLRNGNEGRYYIFYRHAGDSFFGAGLRIFIN